MFKPDVVADIPPGPIYIFVESFTVLMHARHFEE